jgi:nifR3 family TIM-barrel protein
MTIPQSVRIGPIEVSPPVVLAPMAGVTNYPFRALCRRFGAGLYISEMITARPLVEGREKTLKLADFGPDERPRSLQIYGVDPRYVGEAVRRLVGEGRVDHLDLNFGCPVRKVTRKGGGAAIPAKPRLLESIVRAAVAAAAEIPVTIKFRMGIDEEHLNFLESGRIAEDQGCAGVTLHARTAAQLYDGHAKWPAIGELKQALTSIPVFGNGDIWVADDATRMVRETGCDGVAVGRGCLGRPWLFRDLADVFGERQAMLSFRKHCGWYTRGFRSSARLRERLMKVQQLSELEEGLAGIDREEPFPEHGHLVRRGKRSGTQKVFLPKGFWDDPDDATPPDAEEMVSGG